MFSDPEEYEKWKNRGWRVGGLAFRELQQFLEYLADASVLIL